MNPQPRALYLIWDLCITTILHEYTWSLLSLDLAFAKKAIPMKKSLYVGLMLGLSILNWKFIKGCPGLEHSKL